MSSRSDLRPLPPLFVEVQPARKKISVAVSVDVRADGLHCRSIGDRDSKCTKNQELSQGRVKHKSSISPLTENMSTFMPYPSCFPALRISGATNPEVPHLLTQRKYEQRAVWNKPSTRCTGTARHRPDKSSNNACKMLEEETCLPHVYPYSKPSVLETRPHTWHATINSQRTN